MKLSAIIPYQLFILGLVIVSHYTTATVNSGPWICQPLYHSNCLFLTMELSAIIPQQLVILDHGIISHHPQQLFIMYHGFVSHYLTATVYSGPWICQPPPHRNWSQLCGKENRAEDWCKGRSVKVQKKMRTTTGIESFCCMWKNDSDQDDKNYNLKKVMFFDVIHSRFRKNTQDVTIRSMHISESQALTFLWSSFYCIY